MRPVELKITAFGPYVKQQVLNFNEGLGDSKLFLIHGATGSGKTSILDAMLFALYGGDKMGGGRNDKMMRSTLSGDDTFTEVDFTFALGDKIYRVIRTVSPDLKKRTAELHDLSDEKNLIVGLRDVSDRISSLIGFESEQFRQVILLPQGEFKKFLFAKTKERQEILEVLFNAYFYKLIEDRLKEKSKNLKSTLEQNESFRKKQLELAEVETEEELDEIIKQITDELALLKNDSQKLDKSRKEARDELEKGRVLYKQFEDFKNLSNKLARIEEELAESDSNLQKAKLEYEKRKGEESERKQIENSIEELKKILLNLKELYKVKINLKMANNKEKLLTEELALLKDKESRFEERLEDRRKEREKYIKESSNIEFYTSKVRDCKARAELVSGINNLNKKLEASKKKFESVENERVKQNREVERLKHLAKIGRAALLARDLKSNEPCPVCGSTVHPKLAIPVDIIPSDEEIEQAEVKLNQLIKQKSEADNEVVEILATLQTQRDNLSQKGDTENIVEWNNKLQAAKEARLNLKNCEENINKGQDLIAQVKNSIKSREQEHKKAVETAAEFSGSLREKEMQIPDQYKIHGADKIIENEIQLSIAKLKTMNDAWDRADKKYRDLEKQIAAQQSKFKVIKESHEKAAELTKEHIEPDIFILQKRSDESDNVWQEHNNKVAELNAKIERLQTTLKTINEMNKKIEAIKQEYIIWSNLSSIANGENSQRMKFQTFALNNMFQEIIIEANNRLSIMSSGRYELRYKNKLDNARKLAGLDFEIYDELNNATRPVETLSGGESFLASLSLALGLADVVQNHSGGIKLDTIFIDEGFGSLDSETLDMAIRSLMELQKGGRLVGIISHVEELKQQIQTRLEITKTRNGSYAKFIN